MTHGANTQNQRIWAFTRSGQARLMGMLLGIGALLAAGLVGYSIWSLLGAEDETKTPDQSIEGSATSAGDGLAAGETIEEILGAVQVYVRNKQIDQASSVLEHAATQYPSDQDIRLALGDLYMSQQRFRDAYEQYVAGIEIGPESAIAEFTAGTLANTIGQPELAEAHYSAAMRLDPSNPDTPVYLAAIQMKLNRLDQAKLNLALAGKLAPESVRVYAMRAQIALRENKPTIAIEQIHKARAIEPNTLGLILLEARATKRLGNPQDAIDLLTALPMDANEDREVVSLLAECFAMVGKPDEAASRLMDLSQAHPDDDALIFEVALALQRADRLDESIEWAKRARDAGNSRAAAWLDSLP